MGAQAEDAVKVGKRALEIGHRGVMMDFDMWPIVEAGAKKMLVVKTKAKPANQVKRTAGRGAEAGNVAGIGRNFWGYKDDFEHGKEFL